MTERLMTRALAPAHPWYLCSIAQLPPLSRGPERADWVDIAKGVSISLVVLWHTVGDRLAINETLLFLRMPLFFFLAGLFLRATFWTGHEDRWRDRTANLLYIYLLWSVLLFALTILPRALATGAAPPMGDLAAILVEPLNTIWFVYALLWAVLALMVLRHVPIVLVLALAAGLYALSVSDGVWRGVPFAERVIRLFPFLVLGVISFETLDRLTARFRGLWPLALALYLGLGHAVYFGGLRDSAVATAVASGIGILAVVLFGRWMATRSGRSLLLFIGGHTLYIYLLHRVVLTGSDVLRHVTGLDLSGAAAAAYLAAETVLAILLCAVAGRLLARRRWSGWLFALPRRFRPAGRQVPA